MLNPSLRFHPNLILRTPSQPFGSHFDEAFIRHCLSNAQFLEALYVASPGLYEECIKWREGTVTDRKRSEKLLHALVKYYCRTTSRSTPFGLFAGCSVAAWGPASRMRLAAAPYRRHTRLDMQYLCGLARHLAHHPQLVERLRYFPNSSIYRIGDEVRYIEYYYEKDVRLYQISSAIASDYLLQVLRVSEAGLRIDELTDVLLKAETGLPAEDCRYFVDQQI